MVVAIHYTEYSFPTRKGGKREREREKPRAQKGVLFCFSLFSFDKMMNFFISSSSKFIVMLMTLASTVKASGFPSNYSSHVNVVIPTSLHKSGPNVKGYEHVASHFGPPFWNGLHNGGGVGGIPSSPNTPSSGPGHLILPVVYLEEYSHLCHTPYTNDTEQETLMGQLASEGGPYLLMVDISFKKKSRNDVNVADGDDDVDVDCTAVEKVRRAQHEVGASGVILAMDEDSPFPVVADTLQGGAIYNGIDIPSVLLNKTDADSIKEHIKKVSSSSSSFLNDDGPSSAGKVVMELAYQWPRQETTVTMDFFHSTTLSHSTHYFLSNFSHLILNMNSEHSHSHHTHHKETSPPQLDFRPRYYIMDGTAMGCLGQVAKEDGICHSLCTNNGRYCLPTHGSSGVTGQQAVTESLRRMCIWQHGQIAAKSASEEEYKKKKLSGSEDHPVNVMYWTYIQHFTKDCATSAEFFSSDTCLADVYKHAKINPDDIASCMVDSGDITSDADNTFLDAAMNYVKKNGIVYTPALWINDLPVSSAMTSSSSGGISLTSVFRTWCSGYQEGMAPHVCYSCGGFDGTGDGGYFSCGDPVACAQRKPMKCYAKDGEEKENSDKKGHEGGKKKKKRHVGRWLLAITLLGGIGGYVYYKKYYLEDGPDGLGTYTLSEAMLSDSA